LKHDLYFKEKQQITNANNPNYVLYDQILKDNEIDLPLLDMVQDKVLSIKNYWLSHSHCQAIYKALDAYLGQKVQPFNAVILENNEIKDGDFEKILEGLDSIRYLEKL